jgi:hypothetical protein
MKLCLRVVGFFIIRLGADKVIVKDAEEGVCQG